MKMKNNNISELYTKYKMKRRYYECNFPNYRDYEYNLFKKYIKIPKLNEDQILINNLIKNTDKLMIEKKK